MEISWQIVIVGTALGILQLAVGVFVGRLLPLGRKKTMRPDSSPADPNAPTLRQLQTWSAQLQRVVNGVADDVNSHQARIEQIRRDLGSLKDRSGDGASDFVLRRISDIEATNQEIGGRLARAEDTLRDHARQIADHVARSKAADDPELQGICRELRSRLSEVTD
jgi:hypothetical protein